MARVLRAGEPDDGRFDVEFWQRVGAEGIWAAAHEMTLEVARMQGLDAAALRLQRTVVRTIRRGR